MIYKDRFALQSCKQIVILLWQVFNSVDIGVDSQFCSEKALKQGCSSWFIKFKVTKTKKLKTQQRMFRRSRLQEQISGAVVFLIF